MSRETLGQAVLQTRQALRAAGIEAAGIEARALVAWAAGVATHELLSLDAHTIDVQAGERLGDALARRLRGVPLAHILGETPFHGIRVRTDARALVPRNDSETLVEVALSHLSGDATACIADLGTGTGCLLKAVLAARPGCTGIAVEIDAAAADLAAANLAGLGDRVRLLRASWKEALDWTGADLVLSNPPYIRTGIIPTLQADVRDHDPHIALDGGLDGLAAYREIISLAGRHAAAGTPLVLEIGHDQAEPVSRLLESGGYTAIVLTRDLSGQPRVLSAVKNSTRI